MDNGEVIPALNEQWTFGGANATEWMSGFVMFLMSTEMFEKISRSMPMLLVIWLATTFGLSYARRAFPDEERGLRNFLMTIVGIAPQGLPPPAALVPVFSASPMRQMQLDKQYQVLKLDDVFELIKQAAEEKKRTGV